MKEKRKDQTWKDYLLENQEEVTVKLARFYCNNYGTGHQLDLYLWEDGTWTEFSNPGGDSWLEDDDLDHVVLLSVSYDYPYFTEEECLQTLESNDIYTTDIADYFLSWLLAYVEVLER